MKKEIKNKWCEALRSGEYNQGEGKLCLKERDEVKYCCLGVLTDLYIKETGDKEEIEWLNNKAYLSDKVMNWAGLDSHDPSPNNNGEATLAGYNDNEYDFKYIANLIEEYF